MQEKPVGGVININSIKCFEFPTMYIDDILRDLDGYEDYDEEVNVDIGEIFGFIECDKNDPDMYFSFISTDEKTSICYKIDKTREFAGLINNDSNTVQIVWSKYTKNCLWCSPCYPGQGDLDSDGDVLTYAVPQEFLDCEEL